MNLLQDRIRPMFVKLLAAALGSAMVASIFALVDAMMVGRYHGPAGTAALAVFNPIWSLVYSLGILAGAGGSVLFANLRGNGRKEESDQYFTLTVLFGLGLSAFAMVLLKVYQEPLLRFFGADDELLSLAQQYLKPIWYAIPWCVFSNIQSAYLRNDGGANLAMGAVLVGGVFNVFGDYFFVFVLDMGIAGAGLATSIGIFITGLVMLIHHFRKGCTLRFAKIKAPFRKLGRICVTGFPTAISDLSMGIISILFNRQIMAFLGSDALSVYGILTQVVAFVQCCSYGAGQAAQPIISQNHGARQMDRVKQCLKYGLVTSVLFGLAWTAAALIWPNGFVELFMEPTDSILAIAPGIIRAYGSSFLILPFNIFATYYFQAIMKPQISMAASLGRGLLVSGALILLMPLILGAESLWFAMVVTELVILGYCLRQMTRCTRAL